MTARFTRWLLITLAITSVHVGAAQDASAQRLFERLRALRQQRMTPPSMQPRSVQRPPINRSTVPATSQRPGQVLATPPSRDSGGRRDSVAETKPKASFGLEVTPGVTLNYPGLEVVTIYPSSLADEAGMREGDLIVKVGPTRILSLGDVPRALGSAEPGQKIEVQLFRDGQLYRTNVGLIASGQVSSPGDGDSTSPREVGKVPVDDGFVDDGSVDGASDPSKTVARQSGPRMAAPRASMGIEVEDAAPQRGVTVLRVPSRTAGQAAGVESGDRLVSVNGRILRKTDDLMREVAMRDPGDTVTVGIVRDNNLIELDVRLAGPNGIVPRAAKTTKSETRATSGDSVDPSSTAEPNETVEPSSDTDPLALPADETSEAFGSPPSPVR